jgi:predicted secreted protein
MAVINATSFLLLKDTTVIGHSKSTSFNVNVDLPDATNKESGGFKEVIAGVKSGTISCECLTNYTETLDFSELASMVITKEKAVFYFKDNINDKFLLRGEGFVSAVDETAEFNNATTFNLEINLTGVFTITDPSQGLTWDNVFAKWEDIADNWEDV